jgi:hypothetical protein
MNKLALLMIAVSALVSGCVAYVPDYGHGPQHGNSYRNHDGGPYRIERDRDGDGVPNWQDRRPDNPRRY